MSLARRVPIRVALAAVVAAALSVLTLAPAQAAAYRFWGFYQLTNGAWAFAQKGPDQIVPKEGAVDGWRYAVGDESSSRFPRAVLTFDQICGSTPAQAGKKRVGLVVDYGRPADAAEPTTTPPQPEALCAVVGTQATSTDVLAAAGQLRIEKGLVCAVAGYPASDCGGEVKTVTPEAKAADTPITIAVAGATSSAVATPLATAAANAGAPTQDTSSGTSSAAYIIAGLVILAILAFVFARSRAGRRTS